jgi:hypothetical protein
MVVPRLWVSLKVTAEATGSTYKALCEQIRKGTFPFTYRRAGRRILVSARGLDLVPINEPQKGETRNQAENLQVAA